MTREGVKYSTDENYGDTLYFRSYGSRYSVRYDAISAKFAFCSKSYSGAKALMTAIGKECRGFDGKIGS
ncbi:hypothetical protein D3C79_931820 [compost metagenome]